MTVSRITVQSLLRSVVTPIAAVCALIAIWQIAVVQNDISPLVLPRPSAIGSNLIDHWHFYLDDGMTTLGEAMAGFAIAVVVSLMLAGAMTSWRIVRDAVNPIQTALRSMPVVALAPALVLWTGFGATSKIAIAAIITFPPFIVNALTGFSRVDASTLEVFRSFGASRWEIFRKLRVPSSLPYLFAAAKVCVSLALVGAVVGEWAGSSEGLGYRITRAQSDLETTTVWGATVALALFGMVLTGFVALAEKISLRHHTSFVNKKEK